MLRARLATLYGATARDARELMINAEGLRVLDQEIRDAAACLGDATRQLTGLTAREIQDRHALDGVERRLAAHEDHVREARDKGDDIQAIALAKAVATARRERDRHVRNLEAASRRIAGLRSEINAAGRRIADLSRQLTAARGRAPAHRADALMARHAGGAPMALAAAEAIQARIRALHADSADWLAPAR